MNAAEVLAGRYDRAWKLTESAEGVSDSLLVECGPPRRPYWWVICPASATLILGSHVADLPTVEDDCEGQCSIGLDCDWWGVHAEANRLIRKRAGL